MSNIYVVLVSVWSKAFLIIAFVFKKEIICKVRKIRDACILLAGHRCYREYPGLSMIVFGRVFLLT